MLIILLAQTEEEFLCKITDRARWSVARKIIKIGFYAKKMTESRDLIFPHKRTKVKRVCLVHIHFFFDDTVKLGNKERFDKEQIGIREPYPVTNLPFTS